MRRHLVDCLESQFLSAFPVMRKRRRANKVKVLSTVPRYCSCRMPEQCGCTMIQCSTCKEWFHVEHCVTVPTEAFDSAACWFCSKCTSLCFIVVCIIDCWFHRFVCIICFIDCWQHKKRNNNGHWGSIYFSMVEILVPWGDQ